MSLIESITQEEFEASAENVFAAEGTEEGESVAVAPSSDLTWCEFCKGSYNEYHFGEPEGGETSLPQSQT